MKITYFMDYIFPEQSACTVHVMRMCQGFSKLGHDVTLCCDTADKNPNLDDIWEHYGTLNKFNIKLIHVPDFLRTHGHRLSNYYSAWRKARLNITSDLIYSRSAMALLFAKSNCPFIYEAHVSPDIINLQIEKRIVRRKNCLGIVVISQALKEEYKRLFPFFPEDRIVVLHDGADAFEFDSKAKAELRGMTNEIKIGYLGHLYPGKCMETLLPLAKYFQNYEFHVVGGTDYWVNYWKTKAEKNNIFNLYFYGYVNNADVVSYYNAFDICVLPFSKNIFISKNKRVDIGQWTSPIKLFECMASGKPMVVSRLATIEEVLLDNEDCIFAEPDNIDDWCDKLKFLINNENLQKKIAKSAKDKLEQKYTWEKRCEMIIDYVAETVSGKSKE